METNNKSINWKNEGHKVLSKAIRRHNVEDFIDAVHFGFEPTYALQALAVAAHSQTTNWDASNTIFLLITDFLNNNKRRQQ